MQILCLGYLWWNPTSSFTASLALHFATAQKILKDNVVTYGVHFGRILPRIIIIIFFAFSPVFVFLNFLLGGIFNQPCTTLDNEE